MQILSTQLGLQGVECGRSGMEAWKYSLVIYSLRPHIWMHALSCCPLGRLAAAVEAHSSLEMMEKGSTGLLASSSRAVRKQSTAASFWP